ncbi:MULTISPECIES: polysaccharide biosynthesis tyrosine autokinase [unclassified Cobetia]|uniref:polysaccharide biosynthesis tyrosine autokinase n=1 Tax=unclassified Cobetia TaxID=2609414 RepID=UPI00178D01B1|nr:MULTISPECIES: polysaccharide biosynthesis tyrosine autokinase [unclassified Cobetia]MBE2170222.1 polysaccharide biosynthesis tyrosine autokinase [Cobetia sp. 2AS1]MDH2446995.1 polysaccharide biosynthesis tyrosine autokinase [Cobetia sp. 2AS]
MSQTPTPVTPADDDLDLGRYFGLLVDHKWWIVTITVLFGVMGSVYATLQTPIYRADSLVQIESGSNAGPIQGLAFMTGEESKIEAELGILQSRMVLGQAVDQQQLTLSVTPVRFPIIGEFLSRQGMTKPSFSDKSAWAGENISVGKLQVDTALNGQALQVRILNEKRYRVVLAERELGVGEVGVNESFADGRVALRIADIQARPGSTFNLRLTSRLAAINSLRGRLSVNLQGKDSGLLQLALQGPDADQARRTLDTISEVYLLQNIQRQAAEAEKSLAFLEDQAPKVRKELGDAEDSLNAYRSKQESVDLSMETQTMLTRSVELEKQLNELNFSEKELRRRFTPSHPQYQALMEKKAQISREKEQLELQVEDLPETQQQILRMRRDVEVNQEVYVQLLNKIQEMRIAKAGTVGNVRILDEAVAQPTPIAPHKKLIIMLTTIMGGMLSVVAILVIGLLRRGVEAPEQLEALDIPVYATVPLSEEQARNSVNPSTKTEKVKIKNKRKKRLDGLLASRAPTDISIEALRGLRTSLHFAMLDANNNCVMITGPSPGVGKSFISANFAAVCAQGTQKVLVIDADMRKGHMHEAFGAKSAGGLSEYLSGSKSLDDIIRASDIVGLSFITRGIAPPNPAELLMQNGFSKMLQEVSERFDLVIIDTPPVLAVTDAAVVGKQVGTTLLVARYGLNPPKEVSIAKHRLGNSGVQVKGAILNAVERRAATSYGNYGYYNYSYK